nr:MAG TPA: hypothetical protein [Caudoviricetes sp.]
MYFIKIIDFVYYLIRKLFILLLFKLFLFQLLLH